jgi:hypothetical protein
MKTFARILAKLVDSFLFALPLIAVDSLLLFQTTLASRIFLFGILNLGFPVWEAFCIHTWGTTPGKAFFNLKIQPLHSTLGFQQNLARSFRCYAEGFALGIPFLNVAAAIRGLWLLSHNWQLPWDHQAGMRVVMSKPAHMWKYGVAVGALLTLFAKQIALI